MFVKSCSIFVLFVIFTEILGFSALFNPKEKWSSLKRYVAENGAQALKDGQSYDELTSKRTRQRSPRDGAVILPVDGSSALCDNIRGWNIQGTEWGCCGNYKGCCTYASLACFFHDAVCRCCDLGKGLCGPNCQPDIDCTPPHPWPWEDAALHAGASSNIPPPATKKPSQEKEMTSQAPQHHLDIPKNLDITVPNTETDVTADLPDLYLENTTPFADYFNDEYDDDLLSATIESTTQCTKKNIAEKTVAPFTDIHKEEEIVSRKEHSKLEQQVTQVVSSNFERTDEDHEYNHNQTSDRNEGDAKKYNNSIDPNGVRIRENGIDKSTDDPDLEINSAHTNGNATFEDSHLETNGTNLDGKVTGNTTLEDRHLEYGTSIASDMIRKITSEDVHTGNKSTKANHEKINDEADQTISTTSGAETESSSLPQPPPPLPPPPPPVKILKPGNVGIYLSGSAEMKQPDNKETQTVTNTMVVEETDAKQESEYQIEEETHRDFKVESGNWIDETFVYSENINDASYVNSSDSDISENDASKQEFETLFKIDKLPKDNKTNVHVNNMGQREDKAFGGELTKMDPKEGHALDTSADIKTILNDAYYENVTDVDDVKSALNKTWVSETESESTKKTEDHLDTEGIDVYDNKTLVETQRQDSAKDTTGEDKGYQDEEEIKQKHETAKGTTGEDIANQDEQEIKQNKETAKYTTGEDKANKDEEEIKQKQETANDPTSDHKADLRKEEIKHEIETAKDTTDKNKARLEVEKITQRQETAKYTTDENQARLDVEDIKHGQETAKKDTTDADKANLNVEDIKRQDETGKDTTNDDQAHLDVEEIKQRHETAKDIADEGIARTNVEEIKQGQKNAKDTIDENKAQLDEEEINKRQETANDTTDGDKANLDVEDIKRRDETAKDTTDKEKAQLDVDEIKHGQETAKDTTDEDKAHIDVERIKNTLEHAEKSDYIPTDYFNDFVMDKELFNEATEVLGVDDKSDIK